jgi:hypothetical protein
MHVVWRGNALTDVAEIAAIATGHRMPAIS